MPRRTPDFVACLAPIVLGTALAVLYVIRPALASPTGPAIPPALSALRPDATPKPVPPATFLDAQGKPKTLSAFRGQVVILNTWATWCAPCVAELPAVGKLSAALGSGKVTVVAVNAGRDDAAATAAFLKTHGAANLAVYRDPGLSLLMAFGSQGLPFSVVIDAKGREIARASGPMKWSDPAAIAYFKALGTQ
jgi:thiol-disulfide isomerase/thioredoxin